MLILTAFPLDNPKIGLYTIPILQQGCGEHSRTKRPTRRGINRAGYILFWIFRGEAPLDCWSSGKSGPFS